MADELISSSGLWQAAQNGSLNFDFWKLPFPLSEQHKKQCRDYFEAGYACRLAMKFTTEQLKNSAPIPPEIQVQILREFLFDSAEYPGLSFACEYEPFATLIHYWESEESGESGIRSLNLLHERNLVGARVRRQPIGDKPKGGAQSTVTDHHRTLRDGAIKQLKPLVRQIHALVDKCRVQGLSQSVLCEKLWPVIEGEIKTNPSLYSAVCFEPHLTQLRDSLKAAAREGKFILVCRTATSLVDWWMALFMYRSPGQVRKWEA